VVNGFVVVVDATEVVEVVSAKDSNNGLVPFNVLFLTTKPVKLKSNPNGLIKTISAIKVMAPTPAENNILLV
jgi:hypothetical protein